MGKIKTCGVKMETWIVKESCRFIGQELGLFEELCHFLIFSACGSFARHSSTAATLLRCASSRPSLLLCYRPSVRSSLSHFTLRHAAQAWHEFDSSCLCSIAQAFSKSWNDSGLLQLSGESRPQISFWLSCSDRRNSSASLPPISLIRLCIHVVKSPNSLHGLYG